MLSKGASSPASCLSPTTASHLLSGFSIPPLPLVTAQGLSWPGFKIMPNFINGKKMKGVKIKKACSWKLVSYVFTCCSVVFNPTTRLTFKKISGVCVGLAALQQAGVLELRERELGHSTEKPPCFSFWTKHSWLPSSAWLSPCRVFVCVLSGVSAELLLWGCCKLAGRRAAIQPDKTWLSACCLG